MLRVVQPRKTGDTASRGEFPESNRQTPPRCSQVLRHHLSCRCRNLLHPGNLLPTCQSTPSLFRATPR